MNRFWTSVAVTPTEDGFAFQLDGRPLLTPARHRLLVQRRMLAEAIAGEWEKAPASVLPQALAAALPLTGIANAAIDIVAPDPRSFATRLAGYAQCDTLCYRATQPELLVARQATIWEPMLLALERRLGIAARRVTDVAFIEQPPATLDKVTAAYRALDPFRLAALSPIVSLTASAFLGLVLAEGIAAPEAVWQAGLLEELWNAERWGDDDDAAASRARRRVQFDAAARFLALLG